jgi:hypothetical protein
LLWGSNDTDTSVEVTHSQLDLFRSFEFLFETLGEGGTAKYGKQ